MGFAYRKTQKLGKVQFIAGPEGFTLCRHDEFGIANLKKRCMVKQTNLYREFMLRLRARKITQEYYDLTKQGLFSWPAYMEHRESIQASFNTLRRALKRYRDRRIKAGFFYMYAHPNLHLVYVMMPLYTMPRQEALKKIRRLLRNREAYAPAISTNPSSAVPRSNDSN
ncbi:hypothetical protein EJB05_04028, partial [Eragrostis curvula]